MGEKGIAGAGPFCLGGVASPYADPLELQVLRLAKKVGSGAQFLITPPVFDLDRFAAWWQEVTRRGLHEKAAIVAGIQPLGDGQEGRGVGRQAPAAADSGGRARRGWPPERSLGAACRRHCDRRRDDRAAERPFKGLRGFQICLDGDVDAALEVIDKASLGTN